MLLFQSFQAGAEVVAHGLRVVHQAIFLDQINGGFGSDAGYGIPAESGNGQTLVCVGDFRAREREADGSAVGHALGAGDNVGLHLPMLNAPPLLAGASPGSLHFVSDK